MIPMNTPPELRQFERENSRRSSMSLHDACEFMKRWNCFPIRRAECGDWVLGFNPGRLLEPWPFPKEGLIDNGPEEVLHKAMEFLEPKKA